MSTKGIVGEVMVALEGCIVALGLVLPAWAADAGAPMSASHESLGRTFNELVDQMQGLGERFRQFLPPEAAPERPLITIMLDHRREIGLTPAQVQELERIRTGYQREAIKLDADQRVAQIDLGALLEADPVDLAKAEAKIRDIERLRADLRIARIRAIEQGKAQLTAEQRDKLATLLGESRRPRAGGGAPMPMTEGSRRL